MAIDADTLKKIQDASTLLTQLLAGVAGELTPGPAATALAIASATIPTIIATVVTELQLHAAH